MTRWWARQDSNLQPDRYERRVGIPFRRGKAWNETRTDYSKSPPFRPFRFRCGSGTETFQAARTARGTLARDRGGIPSRASLASRAAMASRRSWSRW